MKEIGEFLKSSRIQKGVSIEEASDDLEVLSIEIENLEEGNNKEVTNLDVLRRISNLEKIVYGKEKEGEENID